MNTKKLYTQYPIIIVFIVFLSMVTFAQSAYADMVQDPLFNLISCPIVDLLFIICIIMLIGKLFRKINKIKVLNYNIIADKYIFIPAILIILLWTGIVFIGYAGGSKNYKGYLPVAVSVLQSLQSSAAIYVAQQRVPPTAFSNFVVASGKITGAKTFSLENLLNTLSTIPKVPTSGKDPLVLIFKGRETPKYYLNGSDITAIYEGF